MAYLQSAGGEPVPPEVIESMSRTLGFSIPQEDIEQLSIALRDQLASLTVIEELDLSGIAPILSFDPRWHD